MRSGLRTALATTDDEAGWLVHESAQVLHDEAYLVGLERHADEDLRRFAQGPAKRFISRLDVIEVHCVHQ